MRVLRNIYFCVKIVFALWGVIFLVMLLTPVCSSSIARLQVVDRPESADSIVVLGASILSDGEINQKGVARIVYAIQMYRRYKAAPTLIFSGSPSEVEAMARLAHSLGVPEKSIIVENQTTGTVNQALEIKRKLNQGTIGRILMVTSPVHSFRAVRTFRKVGVSVISTPSYPISKVAEKGGVSTYLKHNIESCEDIVQELPALIFYWWKGWL